MERQVSVGARAGGGSRTAPFGLLGDERLARLAAAGHTRAFAVVYERHHQALYRYCRSILRNDADAQDALQSAFAAAFAALGRDQRDAPIRPWLFRIAHNEAISVLRRRRPTTDLSAASDCCTTSVEDQVAERAELGMLLRDLRELNERQRSALVMRELSGLSHEEIAIALDTSVGAAKQTIYEARRSLFEFAEGRAVPCDEIRRTISDADGRLMRSRRVRAHLRECPGCAAFAGAIPDRSRELRALAPVLPTAVAAGMLERIAGTGATHGTGGGFAGLATGAAGKAAGGALAANALAGVAVVATATVGVTIGVDRLVHAGHGTGAGRAATPAVRSAGPHARTGASMLVPATRPLIRPGSHRASGAVSSSGRAAGTATGRRTVPPSPILSRGSASVTVPRSSSSIPGQGPGKAASAPGHSTAPGHSGSAPGHSTSSTTAPGHTGSAPGHSSSSVTAPGKSATAPRHASSSSTAVRHSGSASGQSGSSAGSRAGSWQSITVPIVAPATPAVASTSQVPLGTTPGDAASSQHKH